MSDAIPKTTMEKYGEWVWRVVILVILTGQLWVSSHFVSKEEFSIANKKLDDVHDKVLVIEQSIKIADTIDRRVDMLSEQVIKLDRDVAELKVRLNFFEKQLKP